MMKYGVTWTKDRTLIILYGAESLSQPPALREVCPSCWAVIEEPTKYPYGTHYTKMMLLTYEDGGLWVVVHTANLVPGDWENRTQGLWVSDKCPIMTDSDTSKGGSKWVEVLKSIFIVTFIFRTLIKSALLWYLHYHEMSSVYQFISAVSQTRDLRLSWV